MPWVAGWLGLGHDSNGAIQTFRILQLIAMESHKMLDLTVYFAYFQILPPGQGRHNMGGGIQHQRGWLLKHQTTHSLFRLQTGRGGWPTHPQGGRGVELLCPGQVQTL